MTRIGNGIEQLIFERGSVTALNSFGYTGGVDLLSGSTYEIEIYTHGHVSDVDGVYKDSLGGYNFAGTITTVPAPAAVWLFWLCA